MNARRKAAMTIMLLMTVLIVCGMVMVFTAYNAGQRTGRAAMDAHGGSMDTEQYYMAMQTGTNSALIGGTLMTLLGGGGFMIALNSQLGRRDD